MSWWRVAAGFLLFLLALQAQTRRKLVVIQVDGLDARYLRDADRLHLKIPTLRKLASQGTVADGVVGVTPNDSWASAATLVTGVTPLKHGILDAMNFTRKPNGGTLWEAAAGDGLKTAMLYWPGSVGATADYNCPQFSEGNPAADLPFDAIALRCTPGLVQRITSVYPVFSKSQWNDSTALIGLRYLLQYEKPDLSLVHIGDLDQEQRETGALSLYAREVLENEDEMIGQALAMVPEHTQIAVVSDHGFETEEFVVRPRVLIGSKKPQVRRGLIGATNSTDAAALRKLVGHSGVSREVALRDVKELVPEATGWTAAFSTMTNYIATEGESGKGVAPGNHKGVYSFWPLRPNFRSSLILSGDHIKAMRLPEVSILRIAPTLADILGVKLPEAHGASLWPQIRK